MSDPIRTTVQQRKSWETPELNPLAATLDDIRAAFGAGSDGGIETGVSMS